MARQIRHNDQPLRDDEFKAHATSGTIFLHVRVEDLALNDTIQRELDEMDAKGESIFMDLKDIKLVPNTV